jgi:hypothetical protein
MLAVLKHEVPGFAVIRRLAIRFQSLLRHRDEKKLEPFIGSPMPRDVEFQRS